MKRLPLRPTVLRALLAALLLAVVLGAAASVPAVDASTNCTYYSDASHTTVVGQYGTDCCNNPVHWGTKTQYSVCSTACFICFPPPQ